MAVAGVAGRMNRAERRQRREDIAAAISQGVSIADVCARFDIGEITVRAACREFGVVCRTSGSRGPKAGLNTYTILARLLYTGNTLEAIAAEFGVSRQAIHHVLVRARAAGIAFPLRKDRKTTNR